MKTAVAAVCVATAGMGGMKAYNTVNQSEADRLLAENVEALSQNDGDCPRDNTNVEAKGDITRNVVCGTKMVNGKQQDKYKKDCEYVKANVHQCKIPVNNPCV